MPERAAFLDLSKSAWVSVKRSQEIPRGLIQTPYRVELTGFSTVVLLGFLHTPSSHLDVFADFVVAELLLLSVFE